MNPIMVDGTGMCGCCRVTVGGETKFACVDGPDSTAIWSTLTRSLPATIPTRNLRPRRRKNISAD